MDSELWILDSQFLDFDFLNSGQGFRIAQSPKSLDFGLWALDLGLWVMDFVLLRTLVLGYLNFRFSDFGLWAWDLGLWVSDFALLRTLDLGC